MIRNLLFAMACLCSFSVFASDVPYGFGLPEEYFTTLDNHEMPLRDNEALVNAAITLENHGGRTNYGCISFTPGLNENEAGTWTTLANGDRVWMLRFKSEAALAVNVYFNDLHLPEGSSLFLYPADRSYFEGPFDINDCAGHGYFGSPEVFGDEAILEYYEPAGVVARASLGIYGFGHFYRHIYDYRDMRGGSEACEVDVNCPEGSEWTAERDAVIRLQLTDGGDIFLCSGALVNTTAMDCRRYILTAFHCVQGINDADLLLCQVRFNYERENCGTGSAPTRNRSGVVKHADSNDNGGATGSDFALLEMEDTIPTSWSPYFAGWDASGDTPDTGVSIHHPSGDVKKISTTDDIVSGTWGASGFHWRVEWMETETEWGVTEGGSSGSPLFDENHRIVGQLTGGGSFCAQPTANDYYGKMSKNWNANPNPANEKLKNWLDPINQGSTGTVVMFGSYYNEDLAEPCSVSTEIEERLKFDDVQIYPSITSGDMTIATERFRDINEVRVFNSAGLLVEVLRLTGTQSSFDFSRFADGLYYMSFLHVNGTHLTKKFSIVE